MNWFLRSRKISVLYNFFAKSKIIILMYHSISDNKDDKWSVSLESFNSQMELLKRKKYTTISLDQSVKYLIKNKNCKKCIVITFDDGYKDFLKNAAPILKKNNFFATLFIPVGVVGNDSYWESLKEHKPIMDWLEIKKAVELGNFIGSHGIMHTDLTKLTAEDLKRELEYSRDIIKDKLGIITNSFSYPWGKFEEREIIAVKNAGYTCAVTTDSRFGNGPRVNKFVLERESIGRDDSIKDFLLKIGGFEKTFFNIKCLLGVIIFNKFKKDYHFYKFK